MEKKRRCERKTSDGFTYMCLCVFTQKKRFSIDSSAFGFGKYAQNQFGSEKTARKNSIELILFVIMAKIVCRFNGANRPICDSAI